jgi:hypothetical protein
MFLPVVTRVTQFAEYNSVSYQKTTLTINTGAFSKLSFRFNVTNFFRTCMLYSTHFQSLCRNTVS